MRYKDRQGNKFYEMTKQDYFVSKMYETYCGRLLMKIASLPIFSKIARLLLSSKLSAAFVYDFAKKNNIDAFDYQEKIYSSFNNFFTRKIKNGRRLIEKNDNSLISPSDGKITAYEIINSGIFVIKNSVYSLEELLKDRKLAKKYTQGYAVVIRLTVDDYHRYLYPVSGIKSHDRKIKGRLNTVNPISNKYFPVFKENSRHYCMIRSEKFGDIIQMEVGAMMVGKISNHCEDVKRVTKGDEKGFFEFGGSTIILLIEKNKVEICKDLLENTHDGWETKIRQGEIIAFSKK